jgi:protein-S-isoprenylcysteine O-methyltransferase Ste14
MTRGGLSLVAIAALSLRWIHLSIIVTRKARTVDAAAPRREWPATVMGLCYVAAIALWLPQVAATWESTPSASDSIALALILAGAGVRIAGQHTLGNAFSWGSNAPLPPVDLVTGGIYRVLKHPLLLGYGLECAGLLTAVVEHDHARVAIALALMVSLAVQAMREERELAARFGTRWTDYARRKIL